MPSSTKTVATKKGMGQRPAPQRLTPVFTEEYGKLNAAQKQAVDTIEGPVMVIAGPGTGKTQVLALRVANILRKTQMRPSNILCLTFSNSGAKAMRERLRTIIGPDAYGVTVETCHGFCNDLILGHPNLFEDFRALEQISPIERLRVIRTLMRQLPTGAVLSRPTPENDRASGVLSRISEMKKEGITPDALRKIVPLYRAELETTKSGKARDTNSQAYKDDQRLVRQLEEFITLYEGYNAALKDSHRYDFDDMVLIVTEALQKHDVLLASLQERYQYILIDEFQDMNGAQNRIVEILTTYPDLGVTPNLFVVGDDDQAIYRFQGASMRNMLAFTERFPERATITLTENYRSTQPILDAASALIEKNEERLVGKVKGVEKKLTSAVASSVTLRRPDAPASRRTSLEPALRQLEGLGAPQHDTSGRLEAPQFLRFPTTANEYGGIAKILKDAHERGIPWSEMAVLCRRNEELTEMHPALLTAGIPTRIAAKQDLLMHRSVREAITLLQGIMHIDNDAALSAALSISAFDCHPADLGRLWLSQRTSNHERRLAGLPYESLHDFLLRKEDASLPSSIIHARNVLEALHQEKDIVTLPELLEHTLKESTLLPPQTALEADPETIATLHAFYEYVKKRAYEQKSLTLPMLLLDLDECMHEKSLKLEYDLPHIVSDGVELRTAHAAKGLEFTLVVIAHARYRNWGNRMEGSSLSLPDHLIFGLDAEVEKHAAQEDERRLLFVAMTRAKSDLVLTFGESYRSGEEMRPAQVSAFLADIGEKIEEMKIPPTEVPSPIETLYQPPLKIDEAFKSYLLERLEGFSLSVTALNAFLKDPVGFLWTQLLLQPQAKTATLAFGTCVHAALEKRNLALQNGESFSLENLLIAFEATMSRREIMTEHDRKHYLHLGKFILERYMKDVGEEHPLILSAERSLSARLGDIPLTGKIDRIDLFEPNGKRCRVIDYKTGQTYRTPEAVKKKEDLYRQLVFYKMLCDTSPGFTHEATVFTLDFIGNDKSGRSLIEFEIPEKEVTELKELIRAVWGKIQTLDFTKV